MKGKDIAVLLPCYNEEQTIEKVVRDFLTILPTAKIYVYDNNSTDNTYIIANSISDRVIVRKELRQGKGNVIRTMFREIDADCYVMADGDDTYPAENCPEMVRLILEDGYDMVIGDRLSSTYFTENKRPFHNSGNVLVRSLVNRLFDGNVKDIMTGYRAFSKAFVKLTPIMSNGFEVETEMTINALDNYFKLIEVPVDYRDRPEGSVSKLNTFKDGFRVLKTIFFMLRDYRPFMFFFVVFLVLLALAIGIFIPIVVDYYKTGLVEHFPTLICDVGIFIAALLSFGIGNVLDVLIKKKKQENLIRINLFEKDKSTNRETSEERKVNSEE